ncbi:HAD domain-containing protein [Streptomyces sp. NBC_00690]|uniref:HAD domain-containing protein n=1 Tax=Streptomyces sp. NBC_00690 TaxID=2975808 RepID=UPI002E2CF805|nr:HAD domain-containing protein [Streptomyces sp. NBC_00690]
MISSVRTPLLFLDVDGPLIPFGGTRQQRPDGYPLYGSASMRATHSNPLLARIDPAHGPRLAALPCELVWATSWMEEANECVAPWIGLPALPVVHGHPHSSARETDTWGDRHGKAPAIVEYAAGRAFIWVDDEITEGDRTWVAAHHRGRALLHRVEAHRGLVEADYAALRAWLRTTGDSTPTDLF